MQEKLYELSEIVDKKFLNGEHIPETIVNDIKKIVEKRGFIGLAQINPIAGNIEYNAKKLQNILNMQIL